MSFYKYLKENSPYWDFPYNPNSDGPPLKPNSISAAQIQIHELARNIRSSFFYDENFKEHEAEIRKATQLLDEAGKLLFNVGDSELRRKPHKFN